jgi:putative PEP-CTERM system histidine kinase
MTSAAILDFSSAALGLMTAGIVGLRQRSLAGRLFAVGMAGFAVNAALAGWIASMSSFQDILWAEQVSLAVMSLQPGVWLLFSVTYGRGNYREFLAQWRWIIVGAFVIPVIMLALARGQLVTQVNWQEASQEWLFPPSSGARLLYLLCLLTTIFVMAQIERTFWTAVGTMRWRLKFMVLGLGVLFVARFYTTSQGLVYTHAIPARFGTIDAGALALASLLILASLVRESFDVSVYPSRGELHKSAAVVLAGLYLMAVGLSAKLVEFSKKWGTFPGLSQLILLAFVGIGLLILSDRLRLYARRFVSRYLQRPLYDYRTVWRRITEGTASRLTGQELSQASVKLAADIFQAMSVSVWLVDESQENLVFAASTSLSEAMAEKIRPTPAESAAAIQKLKNRLDPVDIEFCNEDWAIPLRRCHPSEFGEEGGSRVCVPMIAAGRLLGLMILGDRVGGVLFSLQDYDLLKCVAEHIAASMLNSQLSQRLLQAREMEAFQTMSAFFVHDLKNTASTLNLMLQNLPVHYDNPAFRQDALRGIAKSCQHINSVIGRLSALRHDLKLRPEPADLNQLVTTVAASWKGAAGVRLETKLGDIPRIFMDADQIQKVLTNLVLNSSEAVGPDGLIRVETSSGDEWVVLSVSDNGCGMTPEFLRGSLFRAFQTTKKDGFGIGMFQSKMIIEAHGGRVEVESELQKGATFRVFLPIGKTALPNG